MKLFERLQAAWYPSPERASSAPFLWSLWRRRLTETGRLLFIVTLVTGLTAITILHGGYPLYHFAVFLIVLLFCSWALGWALRPRLLLERLLPERVAAGASVRVLVRLTNQGRLPAFDLEAGEQVPPKLIHRIQTDPRPQALSQLDPGEDATLEFSLTFERRGAYDLGGPEASTAFPFGLVRTPRRAKDPQRVLVYPRFRPLARVDLPVGRRHQPGGLALVSRVGDSEEFIGNREYRYGDRLRDLDQRAWARVGHPVVREFQQEYLTRVALVVDTYAGKGRPRDLLALEAAISLGAAVADVLSRLEYIIDIFAAGPDLYHFMAGRSLAHFDSILDVLACLDPNPSNPFPELGPAVMDKVDQIATAVAVFLDWDEDRRRFAQSLVDHGVVLKVVVIRDGPTTLAPEFVGATGGVKVFTPDQIDAGIEIL